MTQADFLAILVAELTSGGLRTERFEVGLARRTSLYLVTIFPQSLIVRQFAKKIEQHHFL